MKTKKVKVELEGLKEERKNIKEFSMFGNNNWKTIDTEIEYLERLLQTPTNDTLQDITDEIDGKISDMEDECEDSDYEEMDQKRQSLQNVLSILDECE